MKLALDRNLPFSHYIERSLAILKERRLDIQQGTTDVNLILQANAPYEFYPDPSLSANQPKYGALLIHGLLDSPFSLRDIALKLRAKGILTRGILLPGHGTTPDDLVQVTYQEWIQAVQYGIESLKKEVDKIILVGYSTGAALAIHHALSNPLIGGLVLISPAIKIKAPVNMVVGWHYLLKYLQSNNDDKEWLYTEPETDYAKYQSIPFNAIHQVAKLTNLLFKMGKEQRLNTPMLMILSREDETISSHRALDFFSSVNNPNNQLLLYTSWEHRYPDKRILTRPGYYTDLNINHLSHISLPFSPENSHYGQNGNYQRASHSNKELIYGAYNHIEIKCFDWLCDLGLLKLKRHELTYNPDFDFMMRTIEQFIFNKTSARHVQTNQHIKQSLSTSHREQKELYK